MLCHIAGGASVATPQLGVLLRGWLIEESHYYYAFEDIGL